MREGAATRAGAALVERQHGLAGLGKERDSEHGLRSGGKDRQLGMFWKLAADLGWAEISGCDGMAWGVGEKANGGAALGEAVND
ncbi:hypothetical protein M0R45_006787 [Rubus argutus]|uniref:Uncharacterized protein n=1 Tax=Rubus argutus TaxID=59490 RepID=A0AAW1YRG3_RUBAR